MKMEVGVALAALALCVVFTIYLISFFTTLTKSELGALAQAPWQVAYIGMMVLGFPGLGMAIVTYVLSKKDGMKIVSIILLAQGIIVLAGSLYSLALADNIIERYKNLNLSIIPMIFIAAGGIEIGLGAHLYRFKPVKRKRLM